MKGLHQVGEVVEAVPGEDGVHDLQHLPHVRADVLGGEVAGEAHGLLVELDDGVGEDVVDGLQDDGLQGCVHLRPFLHDRQDGLHGVEETHRRDGFLVARVTGLEHLNYHESMKHPLKIRMKIIEDTNLSEGSNQMLANDNSHGDELLHEGADYHLHHSGEVVALSFSDDL